MSTPQALTADRYFDIREERIQRDKERQIERLTDPDTAISLRAGIEATELYQRGVVRQDRENLRKYLSQLAPDQWVRWIILIPKSAVQSQDNLVTMSGYVLSVDMNRGHATVKIQCNPEGLGDQFEYGKEVVVPMSSITQVMNPQPVADSGPVFSEAQGPAFGKGKAGEFIKGGI